jgi:hypothetical protein
VRVAHERAIERLERALRVAAEASVASGFRRAGEGADRLGRVSRVGEQVEAFAGAPGMARHQPGATQPNRVVESHAGGGEELIEHPAHRQHRRPRIDGLHPGRYLANLAARRLAPLDDDDLGAARAQLERRGQAAHTSADHDNAIAAHDPR